MVSDRFSKLARRSLRKAGKLFLQGATGVQPNKAFIDSSLDGDFSIVDSAHILKKSKEVARRCTDYSLEELNISDKRFLIVLAPPRSGAAYLTRALRENLSPYYSNDYVMCNESIPRFSEFYGSNASDRLREEFIQVVLWAETYYPDFPVLVKKNSGAGFRPDLLFEVLGNQIAEVLLAVRHPKDVYFSFQNTNLSIEGFAGYWEEYDDTSFHGDESLFLDFWKTYYMKFIRLCPTTLMDKVTIVPFGCQNQIIDQKVETYTGRSKAVGLEEIRNRSKDSNSSFWNSSVVEKRIQDVENYYSNSGLNLYVPR